MTFTYQFDTTDWIAFYVYHLKTSRAYHKQRFRSRFVFIPVALVFVLADLLDPERDFGFAPAFSAVAVVWFFVWPKVSHTLYMNRISKTVNDPGNAKVFGKRTTTLAPEGIHVSLPGMESTIAWDNVIKVAESPDRIFIYVSAVEAIVIPRLTLEGASFEEVRDQIQRYHAGSSAAAPTGPHTIQEQR